MQAPIRKVRGAVLHNDLILTRFWSDVDKHLEEIVPRLLKVFSSREGYKAFDDALPVREYFLGYECSEAYASK